jgi:hypothetical protein
MTRCAILLMFTLLLSAQNRAVWQNLSQLQTGDRVKLSVKGRDPVTGPFQAWTPEQVTVGSTTAAPSSHLLPLKISFGITSAWAK